ncbi:hypothetical protein KZ829_19555 [Actinoplanes hulinensis]|uniref:Uncharacterized protein n=1 Tax=Actinoplanes hulinensis TaxID=1144547 RepID=A0ABS7B4K2_9ACTN|nr:hypothetical protein [Actinoplanes hulinensis]MBW6435941.1 hypothetical protein [Actinoplanes hulinensis]
MGARIHEVTVTWLADPGEPVDAGTRGLIAETGRLLAAAVHDRAGVEVFTLCRWLRDAAQGTALHGRLGALPGHGTLANLYAVDDRIEYREPVPPRPGPYGSTAMDIGLAAAEIIGGGIAGNAAYEMVKASISSFWKRDRRVTEEPTPPLTRAEALAMAVALIDTEWPELAEPAPPPFIRAEERTESGTWRFVLDHPGQVFTVLVPAGRPDPSHLTVSRYVG